jgi:hypothetical protein
MLSLEEEAQVRALTHLVTVLIRRISETDKAWCDELLQDIRGQRQSALVQGKVPDEAFKQVIKIIERAVED